MSGAKWCGRQYAHTTSYLLVVGYVAVCYQSLQVLVPASFPFEFPYASLYERGDDQRSRPFWRGAWMCVLELALRVDAWHVQLEACLRVLYELVEQLVCLVAQVD